MQWLLTRVRWLGAAGMMGFSIASTRLGSGGNRALISIPQTRYSWMLRHRLKVAETRQRAGQVKLLFVGDSVTHNYERSEEPYRNFLPIWDELFAPHQALNLGYDGDRTYNVLWRLQHGEVDGLAPEDIVVLIGTNNFNPSMMEPSAETAEQASSGILAVIEELHRRMPEARILVLSMLPTSFSADRTQKADAANAQVKVAVAELSYARYLDVTGIFMDGKRVREELFYDPLEEPGEVALHPSVAGQRLMANAISNGLYSQETSIPTDPRESFAHTP